MRSAKRNSGATIGVVGAGLSGLAMAEQLGQYGLSVTLFDKGRRPGGRMSTRRTEDYRFDHGAQYFTARSPSFIEAVVRWSQCRIVGPWQAVIADVEEGRVVERRDRKRRYVGVPGMDAIVAHLAAHHDTRFATTVSGLRRDGGQWRLTADDGKTLGSFDVVVVAIPAAQALALLGPESGFDESLRGVSMDPCWAVMAVFEHSLDVAFDAAFVHASPLSWVARNGSKPKRPQGECWVLHASPEWSRSHIEMSAQNVCSELADAFSRALGVDLPSRSLVRAHRWRYAKTDAPLGSACLWDPTSRLGLCGDWCLGARVENAYLSGMYLSVRILEDLD